MRTEPYWVPGPWPGRLAIVPRPRGGDWLEDEVQAWRRSGVDGVVSLLTPGEAADLGLADEGRLCLAAGLQFDSFPIVDRAVPASKEAFERLTARLGERLDAGQTVVIHCRQGIGRAPLVAIGLLVWSGVDPGVAVERVEAARGCPVPETPEQRRWVLRLANPRTPFAAIAHEGGRPPSPIP